MDQRQCDERGEHADLGFMEFFDWLAGTSDAELCAVAEDQAGRDPKLRPSFPLSPHCREELGLKVWATM